MGPAEPLIPSHWFCRNTPPGPPLARGGGDAHLGNREWVQGSLATGPSDLSTQIDQAPPRPVIDCAETTPPNPPFARGGKKMPLLPRSHNAGERL